MNRLLRAAVTTASVTILLGALAIAPAEAANGCNDLCSVSGGYAITVTRLSPCAGFAGNVCYSVTWEALVTGSSVLTGSYTATTYPSYGDGYAAACAFLSPAATSCSGTGGSFTELIAPNTSACHGWQSYLSNGLSNLAYDAGWRCRTVGS